MSKIRRDGLYLTTSFATLTFLNFLQPEKAAGFDYQCIEFEVHADRVVKPQ